MSRKSFCIPVLGHMADVAGEFEPTLKVESRRGSIHLNLSNLVTGNETIDSLVKMGIAKFVLNVSCLKTMFSRSFDLCVEGQGSELVLGASLFREKVVVEVVVCAVEKIKSYSPHGIAGYFKGTKFAVEVGEIMAVGPEFSFLVDKDFNPLKPKLSSFVRIRCGEDESGPAQFYLENNLLEIYLSKQDWNSYPRVKAYPASVIHSILVLPLITEAVRVVLLEGADSEYRELKWFVRLEKMMEVRGMQVHGEDALSIAQKLLNNCISRSFDDLILDIETENV